MVRTKPNWIWGHYVNTENDELKKVIFLEFNIQNNMYFSKRIRYKLESCVNSSIRETQNENHIKVLSSLLPHVHLSYIVVVSQSVLTLCGYRSTSSVNQVCLEGYRIDDDKLVKII